MNGKYIRRPHNFHAACSRVCLPYLFSSESSAVCGLLNVSPMRSRTTVIYRHDHSWSLELSNNVPLPPPIFAPWKPTKILVDRFVLFVWRFVLSLSLYIYFFFHSIVFSFSLFFLFVSFSLFFLFPFVSLLSSFLFFFFGVISACYFFCCLHLNIDFRTRQIHLLRPWFKRRAVYFYRYTRDHRMRKLWAISLSYQLRQNCVIDL